MPWTKWEQTKHLGIYEYSTKKENVTESEYVTIKVISILKKANLGLKP